MNSLRSCALLLALLSATAIAPRADEAPTALQTEQSEAQKRAEAEQQIAEATATLAELRAKLAVAGGDINQRESVLGDEVIVLAERAYAREILDDYPGALKDYMLAENSLRAIIYNTVGIYSRSYLASSQAWCAFKMGNYRGSLASANAGMDNARGYDSWKSEVAAAYGFANMTGVDFLRAAQIEMAAEDWDQALAACQTVREFLAHTPDSEEKTRDWANSYRLEAGIAFLRGDNALAQQKWAEAAAKDGRYATDDYYYDETQAGSNLSVAQSPKDVRPRIERARLSQGTAARARQTGKLYRGGLINIIELIPARNWSFDQAALYDLNIAWKLAGDDAKAKSTIAAMRAQSLYFLERGAPPSLLARQEGNSAENLQYAEKWGRTNGATLRTLGDYYATTNVAPENPRHKIRLMQALRAYTRALYNDPDFEKNDIIKGFKNDSLKVLLAIGDYKTPVPAPVSALDWKNAGNTQNEAGNLGAALNCYEKALEADPKYADAMSNIGKVYENVGALDSALLWFGKAIVADPKHRVAHLNIGSVHQQLGDDDAALGDYAKAAQYAVTPSVKSQAWLNRAQIFRVRKQWPQALEDAHRALESSPDDPTVNGVAGQFELEAGNLNAAIPLLQKFSDGNKDKDDDKTTLLQVARDLKSGIASQMSSADQVRFRLFLSRQDSSLHQTYDSPAQRVVLDKWLG